MDGKTNEEQIIRCISKNVADKTSGKIRKLATSYAVIFATFILCQEISNSYAQVTFSRDWNAGKRSVSECSQMSIKSAATICQMLLGELKSLATCEMRSFLSTRVSEEVDNPDVFSAHTG